MLGEQAREYTGLYEIIDSEATRRDTRSFRSLDAISQGEARVIKVGGSGCNIARIYSNTCLHIITKVRILTMTRCNEND